MKTLYLDPATWDLVIDAIGNIAVASEPYSQAQDAASAIRTFQGEVFYDTTIGLPYWGQILGRLPPISLVKADMVEAAKTVPGVAYAQVFFTGLSSTRAITGQVQITSDGATVAVAF